VLNTSLNIHEKPIVLSPVNIIDEIVVGSDVPLDYILTETGLWRRCTAKARLRKSA
jgi:predicted NodU family carbamoyl transferase